MGRSVSFANDSVHVEYATFEAEDGCDPQWEWDYATEDFQTLVLEAFPSARKSDHWCGREDRALAENSFAYFGVSEYCGLVSMWVAPKDDETHIGLRDRWIDSIGAKFAKVAGNCFGQSLKQVGRFSNGEALFQPANGVQQGTMGLGFSSKCGWL
jgi:hypothetical protein